MVVTPGDDSADDVAKTNHILTIILIFIVVVVAMLSGLIFMVLNGQKEMADQKEQLKYQQSLKKQQT